MSRAFTKEDAQQDDVVVVARAPLPDGAANLVTTRGYALLRSEESAITDELAAASSSGDERRSAALDAAADELALRLSSAEVREPAENDKQSVRFGDVVTLRAVGAAGSATFSLQIVGVDEADPEEDRISHLAPLARALLGAKVGERVAQGATGAAGARREVEIVAIG